MMWQREKLLCVLVLVSVLCAGCNRYPALQTHNVRLIALLRTACSTQNSDRLSKASAEIEAAHQKGDMDDAEYKALQSVIDTAKSGDWKAAEMGCYEFQKAQVRYY